jgi:multisubunit Na+/H+ antiporter MnhB subunit
MTGGVVKVASNAHVPVCFGWGTNRPRMPDRGAKVKARKGLMRRIATLVVLIAFAAVPASAFAQSSSTCQAYNPQTCTTASVNDGQLPFTGLDVVLLVVGGGMLLGAGFAVRTFSRRLN